jgi:LysM repeat protein
MFLKSLFITIFSLLSLSTFASSFKDSIGVETLSGKKVILYKIEPKDNYYSLGRKYGVSPKKIMDFNKSIPLTIGIIIRIPTEMNLIKAESTPSEPVGKTIEPTLHKVTKKETLYSISALYGMKVADLEKLNNLKSPALSIGKVLKVIDNRPENTKPLAKSEETKIEEPKSEETKIESKEAPKPQPVITEEKTESDSTENNTVKEIPRNKYGITELEEKGTAVWIDDKNLDATKSYALHRTAPVGTVIKITNPMSGRSVFAKVVGRFTENETTKDVIIVITKAAAEAIGVIDKRFYVNIGYGIPNEK